MSIRKLGFTLVLLTLAYGAWPLLATSEALDVCCSDSGDCPESTRCWNDGTPCSPDRDGRCLPVGGSN